MFEKHRLALSPIRSADFVEAPRLDRPAHDGIHIRLQDLHRSPPSLFPCPAAYRTRSNLFAVPSRPTRTGTGPTLREEAGQSPGRGSVPLLSAPTPPPPHVEQTNT